MSISSEINRIAQNVSDSLTAVASKGATVPSGANSDDLPDLISSLPSTNTVTYNLTGGASASVNPSKAITGQGLSLKLTAPTGYALSGVTVTMGGTDITSQVFTPDAEGGGGGGSVTVTEEANTTGITCVITTSSEPTPPSPSETWETLFDNNINFENGGAWIPELGSIYPSSGDTWRVTINGNTYQCETSVVVNQWGTSEYYVGNPAVAGSTDDGQDVPFAFTNRGYGAWNGYTTNASGNYAIKIERLVTS